MIKTATHLADGRELIYFDEGAGPRDERDLHDLRDLPPVHVASEARFDPILREWVVVASHRQGRTYLPPDDECPLCPSTDTRFTEVPAHHYDVVAFENRFPSLATHVPDVPATVDGEALFERRPGVGRCEVVSFSDQHDASFGTLPPSRVRTIFDVWADRTAGLSAVPGVEQDAGTRVVAHTDLWTAFVPAAAHWPFEVHVYPNRRVADLTELDDAERDGFAAFYLGVLHRFDGVYGLAMPYIAAWHQSPVHVGRDLMYAHLELFSIRRAPGKLKYLAGSESGMGVFINDVAPERQAQLLREALS